MQKKFHRSYESLEDIYEFTEGFLDSETVESAVRYQVHFAMEELFTNMVKYNPGNVNEILLDVSSASGEITVRLTDVDVDEFDVTRETTVDIDAPIEKRTPGGLGLHLIHKMVDSLQYDYDNRQSTITFTKGP